ncbi:hypothetical protein NC796_00325 [Aliifodinibius sp. S!AR15-10]|uniref:hypothetical protein n=1 Tax=Aliifodinibius sp. S!AR15-10 TaxID=2950437 RepID=UPI0028567E66|nr:hypothetical protein [Aliifodinibius sp. S!AR15-10]MDR8389558.1 hypothetical protein [Aliifodinibius sp. S!AR15-10]
MVIGKAKPWSILDNGWTIFEGKPDRKANVNGQPSIAAALTIFFLAHQRSEKSKPVENLLAVIISWWKE